MRVLVRHFVAVLASLLLIYSSYRGYAWHRQWVTLHVRNCALPKVIRKVEWQTWQRIYVDPRLKVGITLSVRRMPLDQVLDLIAEQASARAKKFYAIYSTPASLKRLEENVVATKSIPGWTNYLMKVSGVSSFGHHLRHQNSLVSLQLNQQDPHLAALALSRFSKARVLVEDPITAPVTLRLSQAPVETAVSELAKKLHRHWNVFYLLEGKHRRHGQNLAAQSEVTRAQLSPEQEANLWEGLPPEARKLVEQRAQRKEALANMTPEQRRAARAEHPGSHAGRRGSEQRLVSRLMKTTPEQRVERDQRHALRKEQHAP